MVNIANDNHPPGSTPCKSRPKVEIDNIASNINELIHTWYNQKPLSKAANSITSQRDIQVSDISPIKKQEQYISWLIQDSQNTDIPIAIEWVCGLIIEISNYVWLLLESQKNPKHKFSLKDTIDASKIIQLFINKHWESDSLQMWKNKLIEALWIPLDTKTPWLKIWKKVVHNAGINKSNKRAANR